VNEEVEQMDGSAIGLTKLFGGFAIGGDGQIFLFSKQALEKLDQCLLKILQGNSCQCSGECGGIGGLFGIETEWFFEFLPVVFCPFDDVCHVDLSGGQTEDDKGDNADEGMRNALFGAGIGNALQSVFERQNQ